MPRRHLVRAAWALALAIGLAAAPACSGRPTHFSEPNARAHLRMLGDSIGSRPTGTPANARARAYLIDQLRFYGFEVRVQEADAVFAEAGFTARVANIIAVKTGARREAVAIVAHYDSRHDTPGATDDGLGTAVALEAARVLSARSAPTWSLMIVLTDGEEAGLMGARAVVTDPEVRERLAAYLNLESIGSAAPAVLFETGPANEWLVNRWARAAPAPAGGSYSSEIYARLPNDTDFSVLRQLGAPGLNFAAIGDSYSYHTARDTADRVTPAALSEMGANAVAVVDALEADDITARTSPDARYFDLAGRRAVSFGPLAGRILAVCAVVAGVVAEARLLRTIVRDQGVVRLLFTVIWWLVVAGAAGAAMLAQPWALRAAREVYHPWYAHPWRLFALIAMAGAAVGWLLVRLGGRLPPRVRAYGGASGIWTVTIPIWIGLTIAAEVRAPSAAYLWALPLVVAGGALCFLPVARPFAVRTASLLALVTSAVLWLRIGDLLSFMVAVFGRLPIVTPVTAYPALIALAALTLGPPLVAALSGIGRRALPSKLGAALWLLALSIAVARAYAAPAYTSERPLRRAVRYVQDGALGVAFWEVGGNEPGLDLDQAVSARWVPVTDRQAFSAPVRPTPGPFRFRSRGTPIALPAGGATATLTPQGDEIDLELTVRAGDPGTAVLFAFPADAQPLRSSLAGTRRGAAAWWTARYLAPPPDGVVLRATFRAADRAAIATGSVVFETAALPGGEGWQRLPPWLPQDLAVWESLASYIVPIAALIDTNAPARPAAR